MGGYGASRIGMKHSAVFGSLYSMSPCCLAPRVGGPANPANEEALAAVKTPADLEQLSFGQHAQLASAAAWSPNPNNAPFYLDLPIGPNQQAVLAKWAANASLAFIDQYIQAPRRLKTHAGHTPRDSYAHDRAHSPAARRRARRGRPHLPRAKARARAARRCDNSLGRVM
jgi:hypothetical protein